MNNKLLGFGIFAVGAAIGSVIGYQYASKTLGKVVNDELDRLRKEYPKEGIVVGSIDEFEEVETPEDMTKYLKAVQDETYYNYSTAPLIQNPNRPANFKPPYVIWPEEFGEEEGYEESTLTYWSDGVVTDENDDPITDVEDSIGWSSLQTFGDYEEDAVYVKNEKYKMYYEILRVVEPFNSTIED